MTNIEKLKKQVRKLSHQGLSLNNFICVIKENWPLGLYMLKRFGWRSWYSFWFTKLFVADEGGEYDIISPLLRKLPLLLRKPYKIEIEHTTACNKKCLFCAHTFWKEKKEMMSFEQFKNIIDSIGNLKWINIAGIGSPFMNKDFLKMITYAREEHINVNFVDEFDFFDREKAKKVIELGINSIFISFDAAKRVTYESIKRGCNFDKTLRNINTLLKLKTEMKSPFPILHFRFIVTYLNYKEMPEYIELMHSLKNRGIRSKVEFIGLISFPGIEDYYIPLEKIPENILINVFQNALKYKINLYFSHATSCLPSMSKCIRWAEPFILVNGDVIADCAILMQNKRDLLQRNSFGNAFKKPFLEIWNSNKYREFRKLVVSERKKVPKVCYRCSAYDTEERAIKYGIEE